MKDIFFEDLRCFTFLEHGDDLIVSFGSNWATFNYSLRVIGTRFLCKEFQHRVSDLLIFGNQVMACTLGGVMMLCELDDFSVMWQHDRKHMFSYLQLSAISPSMVAACAKQGLFSFYDIHIFTVIDGTLIQSISDTIWTMIFFPHNTFMTLNINERVYRVWQWDQPRFQATPYNYDFGDQWAKVYWNSTNHCFLIFSRNNQVDYKTQEGDCLWTTTIPFINTLIAFSPDGSLIAMSNKTDMTIKILSSYTGQTLQTFGITFEWIDTLRFSNNGKRVMISHRNGISSWCIYHVAILASLCWKSSFINMDRLCKKLLFSELL